MTLKQCSIIYHQQKSKRGINKKQRYKIIAIYPVKLNQTS